MPFKCAMLQADACTGRGDMALVNEAHVVPRWHSQPPPAAIATVVTPSDTPSNIVCTCDLMTYIISVRALP